MKHLLPILLLVFSVGKIKWNDKLRVELIWWKTWPSPSVSPLRFFLEVQERVGLIVMAVTKKRISKKSRRSWFDRPNWVEKHDRQVKKFNNTSFSELGIFGKTFRIFINALAVVLVVGFISVFLYSVIPGWNLFIMGADCASVSGWWDTAISYTIGPCGCRMSGSVCN